MQLQSHNAFIKSHICGELKQEPFPAKEYLSGWKFLSSVLKIFFQNARAKTESRPCHELVLRFKYILTMLFTVWLQFGGTSPLCSLY